MPNLPERWLRGPVADIPALLQPAAHALLQAQDEITETLKDFPDDKLWIRPLDMASVGFHLQHLRGVLDRLFAYARNEALSDQQLIELKAEGAPYEGNTTTHELLQALDQRIQKSLQQMMSTAESELTERREVGRAKIASTQIGLLFHAAEHTMRHTGQLLVTVRIVMSTSN